MSFFSDTASAIKSRLGNHHRASSSSSSSDILSMVKSTPDLQFKSEMKEASSLGVCRFSENCLDDDDLKAPLSRSFDFHDDPSFWKDNNVQVIIRVRPLSSSEVSLQGHSKCVRQESPQTISWIGNPESRFTFDLVADENVSQEMLFKVAGVPMVENCMGGYNSCMFAYGQTGSGKTHTMLGDIEGGTRRHSINSGMTPRVFEFLFSRIQKEREARREEKIRFACKCSFLEIYNEQILDLLDPSSFNLQIREDSKKGIYVENLTEVEVTSARDVIQQLLQGANNRKVAATNMNAASSRSHSVFTCTVESKWESQGVTHHRFSRLNLVDLAGSERQKSSGAEGERLKEATNINKSLSTLGLVIMNLVNVSNGKNHHVPYRDSKLTFLLQDSLGGNAKTIIIANISPAISCSLETLSTLKFAQRAKYIKNHAIVNEDASGDVIAMRVQIQNLKKEVMRLKGLGSGRAENYEMDDVTVSCAESPGPFKWEGFPGLSSPLISDKKMSQKKEYEAALVGAFRREKDKDIALEAMTAENRAAMQLAKQREGEIQSLKMRLRFREAGIKRLEAVASGKISAEAHLLKEKEELLKEIEVLRTQVDRNQEVTRFAMENLRLKEEIRRLKSFCDEEERERMNKHIAALQDKLLEALDWKLMHEPDPSIDQKGTSQWKTPSKDDLLLCNQDPASPWLTSMNEENEFLRMQAIQNQSELDSLRKKLDMYVGEKQKLQSYVNDLEDKLEKQRSLPAGHPSLNNTQMLSTVGSDQIELKTMVDAIATASQREAEVHETAILLSKENEELKVKLKVLIEDNNKLIELYEQAMEENKRKSLIEGQQSEDSPHQFNQVVGEDLNTGKEVENLKHQLAEMHEENDKLMGLYEKAMQERNESMSFKHQIMEMQEEHEKLIGLYEIAMQEREELKQIMVVSLYENAMQVREEELEKIIACNLCNNTQIGEELKLSEKFVEIGRGDNNQFDESIDEDSSMYEESLEPESTLYEVNVQDWYSRCSAGESENRELDEVGFLEDKTLSRIIQQRAESPKAVSFNNRIASLLEGMDFFRRKLVETQEKISSSAETMSVFGSLEKTIHEVDEISGKLVRLESGLQAKQDEYESSKLLYSELNEKRDLLDKKWAALRNSLSSFSTSISFFEQREAQTRARLEAAETFHKQKKDELSHLQVRMEEILDKKMKAKESESRLNNNLHDLKSKLDGETQRLEKDRILVSIDNIDRTSNQPTQRSWQLSGKATELLMSEETITKVLNEMKQTQEKLGFLKKQHEELNKQQEKVDNQIQVAQKDVENAYCSLEEMERKLQVVKGEKETVFDMIQNGKIEFENMVLEYHQCMTETELKKEEMKMLEEELECESRNIVEIQRAKEMASRRKSQMLEGFSSQSSSCSMTDKIVEDLHSIRLSMVEMNTLVSGFLLQNC